MQQAICEHEGSAGVWIWANLVSLWCVVVHLPRKHVKRLAILSAEYRFRLAPWSLRPTGCAWGECRSLAPRGWQRCLLRTRHYHALRKCCSSEQASMPTACCRRCMGRDGLCPIFGGIWAPPLGTPSYVALVPPVHPVCVALLVCVCCFVFIKLILGNRWCVCMCVALFLLNRYWGIVTVPGSFLKAGDLG